MLKAGTNQVVPALEVGVQLQVGFAQQRFCGQHGVKHAEQPGPVLHNPIDGLVAAHRAVLGVGGLDH